MPDSSSESEVVLDRSIDGDLIGVVGDSWLLEAEHVPVTWHSARGVNQDSYDEIKQALCRDVGALSSSNIDTTSSFYYGKSIARAARLAMIAEEVGLEDSADGRDQTDSGEAVNAYYSAALMGLAYNDANLVAIGSTLAALEIHAAQMWCHLKMDDNKCSDEFTKENSKDA
ncbi:hypothetical protein HN51_067972 [Arachis hypogaea]